MKLALEKRNDEYNMLYGDYQIVRKERDNKDYLLEDLRRNISGLVEENSAAKDELFKLVTKLYQMEQDNQVLRNDLKRHQFGDQNMQLSSYMKDLKEQTSHIGRDRVQSSNMDRQQQQQYEAQRMMVERNMMQKQQQN